MGTKERREREREEVKDKILDAARELFVREGYEAVTMRKIAQRIEYSPTAIYFHFKDKREVMRELCDRDFAALGRQLLLIAEIPDPVERLRETGRGYVRFALSFPNHYRLMFMTPHPDMDEDASAIEKGNPEEDAYAFLRATIEDCLAQGRFRSDLGDADMLAQTMWAGMHGVVSLSIAKENDGWVDFRPAVDRAELMSETLIEGFCVRPGTAEIPASASPAPAVQNHTENERVVASPSPREGGKGNEGMRGRSDRRRKGETGANDQDSEPLLEGKPGRFSEPGRPDRRRKGEQRAEVEAQADAPGHTKGATS